MGTQYWKRTVWNTAQDKLLLKNAETGDSSNRSMKARKESYNCMTALELQIDKAMVRNSIYSTFGTPTKIQADLWYITKLMQ